MRKKLLRSRSGFEKPESREEAIMQNILGASNVLEPSESNIEEILKSILYNTPYTKEAEFEIEKILLAIKNNGTYDGEGESRDMKILIAILNGLDYTEEAESRIEELFIEWLHQRSSIKVLEGVPPLTFVAKGNPLINYEISGNTVQSTTPTPDNPIMPEGCGERTGNLWNEDYTGISVTITYEPLYVGDGNFTLSTTTPYDSSVANLFLLSGNVSTGASTIRNGAWLKRNVTAQSDGGYITIAYRHYTNTTSPTECKTMLNSGSTALPYEPYGYKIPISSANTTTPVYLGEVETTRKIKKLVLTGEENIKSGTGFLYVTTTDTASYSASARCICTHYPQEGTEYCINTINQIRFYVNSDVDTFKSHLAAQYAAGTPITVWYVLATETTGIVNEPLMKIGDYADTLSMEQAGVEIPTASGSNTLDVDTTVKPSNIYIEYK